jgi:hypothetical protein
MLGGHGRLLEIDPNHKCLYLSPGWMPSNLKKNAQFSRIFDMSNKPVVKMLFSGLRGIILFDSLGNLSGFKDEIEKFSNQTGLPVVATKAVGLAGLENVILEAIRNLKCF